jgi:hypothetical protein
VLQEIMAKINPREKLIGIGAAVAVVGWVLGLVITNGWYGYSGSQTTGLGAVIAGIVAIVVLYLKYAPGMNITWPAPVPVILLAVAAVAAVLGLLGLFQAFTYDPFGGLGAYCNNAIVGNLCGGGKSVTIYLAAGAVLVGGGIMAWGAYQEWTLSKTAV